MTNIERYGALARLGPKGLYEGSKCSKCCKRLVRNRVDVNVTSRVTRRATRNDLVKSVTGVHPNTELSV